MPTQRKVDLVAELTDKMQRAQMAVVADYRGFTVAEITALRARLREHGAEMIVAKNTLLRLAARNTGRESIEPFLEGPTAITFVYDDIAKVAKVLDDASKVTAKPLKVKGGTLGQSPLAADGLGAITRLPTREQVLGEVLGGMTSPVAQFVGLLDQPASGLVRVLDAAISSLVYALQARADQLQQPAESA